eukprot:Skav216521  [mRNA]  locus=scaffold4485:205582:208836:- [translate_table: standard]
MRGGTARGFDGFSAWELKLLPDELVELLKETILEYSAGLPEWFMRARTCPVPKTASIPTSKQIRPITVLPLLYRLYSAVVCRQILVIWNKAIPYSITGLLPTRGSRDAAYASQVLLERASQTDNPLSGLILDIQKCFNMIWHHVGPPLLRAMGVPDEIVDRWIGSIKSMTRCWDFQQCTFQPTRTSRGFPEGDSHSVLAMLAISVLWVFEIRNVCGEAVNPTAYADNWGWATTNPALNETAVTTTLEVTGLCGLLLDWQKTWFFATTTEEAELAAAHLTRAVPTQTIQRMHHSKDLGFEMRYSGPRRLGHVTDRFEAALQRTHRLTHLRADADEKEKLWLTSIFPQGFYGAEISPPPEPVIKKFRSKVADAIFGPCSAMTPSFALLMGKRTILDPGYLLIWFAITFARRWLIRVQQSQRQAFYELAALFQGTLAHVKGPATALAHYLSQIDWKLDRAGFLHVGPFTKLHILDDSKSRLRRYLVQSWQADLPIRFTERKTLYHMPPISRIDTVAILNTFPAKDRANLIRELSGGFQTMTQQAKWQNDNDGLCVHCSMTDNRYHRIFECPAFEHVRAPYQVTMDWLQSDGDGKIAELPVVFEHQDSETHQLLHEIEPLPVVGSEFFALARRRRDAALPLHVYTDGTCTHPASPSTRRAGFAVVVDLCECDRQRMQQVQHYLVTGNMPDTFQVLSQSRSSFEQDIGRAEFSAMEVVTRLPGEVFVHTDSQTCLQNLDKLRHGTFNWDSGSNLDIATRISSQLHDGHTFLKVKAHQCPTKDTPVIEAYHILGNMFADVKAKETCQLGWSDFTAHLEAKHLRQQEVRLHIQQLYHCLLDLQQARIQAEQVVTMREHEAILDLFRDMSGNVARLAAYKPENSERKPFPEQHNLLFAVFPWGGVLAAAFQNWYDELEWSSDAHSAASCRSGVSWLELALSFSMSLQATLPVIRVDAEGTRQLVMISTRRDQTEYHVTLADMAATMQLMWGHFLSYAGLDEGVDVTRGLNRSLMWAGFTQHSSGFKPRPSFPWQADVIKFVSDNLSGMGTYDHLVDMFWASDERSWDLDAWNWCEVRDKSYKTRRKYWLQRS